MCVCELVEDLFKTKDFYRILNDFISYISIYMVVKLIAQWGGNSSSRVVSRKVDIIVQSK